MHIFYVINHFNILFWTLATIKTSPFQQTELPCIVMSGIHSDSIPEAGHGLVQFLGEHILVTQQRVGIGKPTVNLKEQQTHCQSEKTTNPRSIWKNRSFMLWTISYKIFW